MGLSQSQAWEWVVRYTPLIRKICREACRGQPRLFELMWDEAIDKTIELCAQWDSEYIDGQTLPGFVRKRLRWYLYKRYQQNSTGRVGARPDAQGNRVGGHKVTSDDDTLGRVSCDDHLTEESDRLHRDEVRYLMQSLDDKSRAILTARYFAGMTFEQLASELGVSKGTAVRMGHEALAKARAVLGDNDAGC